MLVTGLCHSRSLEGQLNDVVNVGEQIDGIKHDMTD